jgi:L-asparaginase II
MGSLAHLDDEVVAATVRDGFVDCVHRASAVATTPDGDVLWAAGDPQRQVFERSTVKPFRALACLQSGATERFGFEDADIALIAGSHSGMPDHVERAAKMLAAIGLDEEPIFGEPRLPLGEDALRVLIDQGGGVRKVHGECSGEHIGGLATCVASGYPIARYWEPGHPLQCYYESVLTQFGNAIDVTHAPSRDLCGMPTRPHSLEALAIRLARLVVWAGRDRHAMRLINAIIAHPRVYTGQERLVGDAIEASGGTVIGKCGAEGLYTFAWPATGVGLAVKVSDGDHRAAEPLVRRAAGTLGLPWPQIQSQGPRGAFAPVHGLTERGGGYLIDGMPA